MKFMCRFATGVTLIVVICASCGSFAYAHFPWLVIQPASGEHGRLECYFSENAQPDDPDFLKYVSTASVRQVTTKELSEPLTLTLENDELFRELDQSARNALFVLQTDLPIKERDGVSYLVRYGSKTGKSLSSSTWQSTLSQKVLELDVVPTLVKDQLTLKILSNGSPVQGAEVNVLEREELLTSNEQGEVTIALNEKPINALRVKFVSQVAPGEQNPGYQEIRYYTTLTFPDVSYLAIPVERTLAEIPEAVTSFGAAVLGSTLYYYGGHTGGAHHYSDESQSPHLWALDIKESSTKGQWKQVAQGPRLQGLALVSYENKLYRIGGFEAHNPEGAEKDLWSVSSVTSLDPEVGQWEEMPPLPEGRSSFDAAVLDGVVYVVGGWQLLGGEESRWHETVWSLDLKQPGAHWQAETKAPFERRAVSVAAFAGKIFVMGGMTSENEITTETSIYDPKTKTWAQGPKLIGEGMAGFGSSSFAVGGRLYCSTYEGVLQSLSSPEATHWEMVGNLEHARFFHRMVALDETRLLLIGGASMQSGKFEEVEVIQPIQAD